MGTVGPADPANTRATPTSSTPRRAGKEKALRRITRAVAPWPSCNGVVIPSPETVHLRALVWWIRCCCPGESFAIEAVTGRQPSSGGCGARIVASLLAPHYDVPSQPTDQGNASHYSIKCPQGHPPRQPVRGFAQDALPVAVLVRMYPVDQVVLGEEQEAGNPEFAVVDTA